MDGLYIKRQQSSDKLAISVIETTIPNGTVRYNDNNNTVNGDVNTQQVAIYPSLIHHLPEPPSESTFSKEPSILEDFDNEGENDVTLIYSRHERLALRDFQKEIRGTMDLQKLQNDMVLLLDLNKSTVDEIINAALHKMLDLSENKRTYDQARSSLFTHDLVHQLRTTVQGTSISTGGGVDYDQSWLCVLATLPSLEYRHVGLVRLRHPANLGITAQETSFVIVILAPTKGKGTKTALEMARTFTTIFLDPQFRHKLLLAPDEESFRATMIVRANSLNQSRSRPSIALTVGDTLLDRQSEKICGFGRGIVNDLRQRVPFYKSDFTDGIFGKNTLYKTISTTMFLYFACMLPCIAFGVLNDQNTGGALTVRSVVYSQTLGGLLFAFVGGSPLIVLLTTAPLALYTDIIYTIASEFEINFLAMFACVGLWNSFFLIVYSVLGLSVLMKWSTRSTEEIFAVFISIAFSVDAIKNCVKNFQTNYYSDDCMNVSLANSTQTALCDRSASLLYLLLMLGTLWIGVAMYHFTKTPYLTAAKREILADYALPVAVVIMTFFGSYIWGDIEGSKFNGGRLTDHPFALAPITELSYGAILASMGLGFCLSLLFFMDQNISAALVNAPKNKLKKGTTYHWDLLVIAVINAFLSIFNLPWVHAALPHSPMHVQAMADVEERVDQGVVHKIIVYVRETRVTVIFSHILIGLSLLFLNYLSVIPTAVLYGLFLYIAVTALEGNQLFERTMLLLTEQSAYPPNHYIRQVPQRKIHLFTLLQLLQLAVLCLVGFFHISYVKMFFPVLLFLLIPIRHKIIPKIIRNKFLRALDSDHH